MIQKILILLVILFLVIVIYSFNTNFKVKENFTLDKTPFNIKDTPVSKISKSVDDSINLREDNLTKNEKKIEEINYSDPIMNKPSNTGFLLNSGVAVIRNYNRKLNKNKIIVPRYQKQKLKYIEKKYIDLTKIKNPVPKVYN